MGALTCGQCRYRIAGRCENARGRWGRVAPADLGCAAGRKRRGAGTHWRCEHCGHVFAVSRQDVPRCPACACNDTTETALPVDSVSDTDYRGWRDRGKGNAS